MSLSIHKANCRPGSQNKSTCVWREKKEKKSNRKSKKSHHFPSHFLLSINYYPALVSLSLSYSLSSRCEEMEDQCREVRRKGCCLGYVYVVGLDTSSLLPSSSPAPAINRWDPVLVKGKKPQACCVYMSLLLYEARGWCWSWKTVNSFYLFQHLWNMCCFLSTESNHCVCDFSPFFPSHPISLFFHSDPHASLLIFTGKSTSHYHHSIMMFRSPATHSTWKRKGILLSFVSKERERKRMPLSCSLCVDVRIHDCMILLCIQEKERRGWEGGGGWGANETKMMVTIERYSVTKMYSSSSHCFPCFRIH